MTTTPDPARKSVDISDLMALAAGTTEPTTPATPGRDREWWDRTRAEWSDDDEDAFNATMAAAAREHAA